MLTIQNYNKLFRKDIGNSDWRVCEIFETSTAYLIQLMKPNGEKMQVNLERNAIGAPNLLYELWCWNKQTAVAVANTATPIRTMLPLTDIKYINRLTNNIELLIKNRI